MTMIYFHEKLFTDFIILLMHRHSYSHEKLFDQWMIAMCIIYNPQFYG